MKLLLPLSALLALGCAMAPAQAGPPSPPLHVIRSPLPPPPPAAGPPRPQPGRLVVDFGAATWDRWTNYTFFPWSPKGTYTRERGPDGEDVIKAVSDDSGSMFVRLVSFDPRETPIVRWRWKVAGPVSAARERSKEGDDAAARIYFAWDLKDTDDIASAKALTYIWGNERRQGEMGKSPYTDRVGVVTLRSGRTGAGQWWFEERDLEAEYRAIFKAPVPGPVTAIALLTDTDQTDGTATAWYGPIYAAPRGPLSPLPGGPAR